MKVLYNDRVITVRLKRRDLIKTLICLAEIMGIGDTDHDQVRQIHENLKAQLDEYDNKHREEWEA